jgi:hypothetical protein
LTVLPHHSQPVHKGKFLPSQLVDDSIHMNRYLH